ncbi:hypothetical protein B0T22DRAFT_370865 [Podospora appendiculata]|uniref:Elongin-A n=1 Tax=Podospora appendiculata TaxID=314037 RepID=A0AAE0XKD5_9PEZI|nr:hypothetical protein B0T22DRAFT_370865 [Podospora appendiculata]
MGPRSLTEMCQRVATDNVKLITSLAGVPTAYMRVILKAVTSPEQLHQIELNSEDDIYDETTEHWKRLIKRKYPFLLAKYQWVPSNPKSWYKVFDKYKKTQDELDIAATNNLMADFAARNEQRISRTAKIVSLKDTRKLPPLPKEARSFGGARNFSSSTSSGFPSQPRVKQTFLQKTAKQVREEAMRLRLTTATGKLPVRAGQIARAPEAMLMDKRIERQFDPTATLPRAQRTKPAASVAADQERQNREARLLQIKKAGSKPSQPTPPSANVLNFDDDDDDDHTTRRRRDAPLDDANRFGDTQEFLAATPPAYAHSDDDDNDSGRHTGLTIDDLDSLDTDTPPRSNRAALTAKSPSPKASSPALKPTSRSLATPSSAAAAPKAPARGRSPSPTQVLHPPPPPPARAPAKRKPVDIFNRRPTKRPRA